MRQFFAETAGAAPAPAALDRLPEGGLLVQGGDYAAQARAAAEAGLRCLVSIGFAGALAPELRPGDSVVASAVIDGKWRYATDWSWTRGLVERLSRVRPGEIAGAARAVRSPEAKRALVVRTGAIVVDRDSHLVARAARAHGLGFAIVRVVADPAQRVVPEPAGSFAARAGLAAARARHALDRLHARATLGRIARELA